MSSATRIMILLGICCLGLFTLVAQFIQVPEQHIRLANHTTNTGEVTTDVLIGQTFRSDYANLSAVSVMFATYSGRVRQQDLELHLRASIQDTHDIRTVKVEKASPGDNQFQRFDFEPIADSKNHNYFFFVTAPLSHPGAAAAVDLNTTDLYHAGSAYIVKTTNKPLDEPALVARSGKQTVDVVFSTYHSVPLNTAIVHTVKNTINYTRATWAERESLYKLWTLSAIPGVLFIGILFILALPDPLLGQSGKSLRWLLLLLLVLAVLLRVMYAIQMPVTTDEGNYLYDAQTLLHGRFAGGDGYVKAPLVILWAALWQLVAGNTILAGRLSSVVIGALTLFPIYFIAQEAKNRLAGIAAAAVWALFGVAIVFNIYIHTQPLAIFFGISGITILWRALRGKAGSQIIPTHARPASNLSWFVVSGLLLGLGVASRKSILALGLVPILLILLEGTTWRRRLKYLLAVGCGFLLIIGLFLGTAYYHYGREGVIEAIGLNSAEDGVVAVEISQIEQVRAYSLRGMTPFFRESLPLILMSLVGWGFAMESALRLLIRQLLNKKPSRFFRALLDHILPKLGWLAPFGAFLWAFNFFFEYEGEAFHFFGIPALWYAMGGVLLLAMLLPRPREEQFVFTDASAIPASTQPHRNLPNLAVNPKKTQSEEVAPQEAAQLSQMLTSALLLPVWLGGLIFFYANWIKFHANYIGEFLPPLVVYAGLGSYLLWMRLKTTAEQRDLKPVLTIARRLLFAGTAAIFIWAMFVSNFITYVYEHTGTFSQKAANEAAAWAKANIPLDQPIFTGAALIPYLSGHKVVLDIAHPRWYAYSWIRENPKRLETFLPPAADMLAAYRTSQWFLLEGQTGFSFLMEYSEIEAGLEHDWQVVKGIENGSNTLTFYRRLNSPPQ